MLQKFPALSRIFSKLIYDLVPAAVASAVGAVLFNNLAKPNPPAPKVAISEPANADIVIQMLRDERALFADYLKPRDEAPSKTASAAAERPATPQAHAARPMPKPRQVAARQPVQHAPVAEEPAQPRQTASIAGPMQPASSAPPLSLAPPPAAAHENIVIAKLRDVTATVERVPSWVGSVFASDAPPRPPADVPMQNFLKAEM